MRRRGLVATRELMWGIWFLRGSRFPSAQRGGWTEPCHLGSLSLSLSHSLYLYIIYIYICILGISFLFYRKIDSDTDAVQLSQLYDGVGGRAVQQQLLY